jgi:hypothetical protein
MKCNAFDTINAQIKEMIVKRDNANRRYDKALREAKSELEALLTEQMSDLALGDNR